MDTTGTACINPVIFHSLCDYGAGMMMLIKRQTSRRDYYIDIIRSKLVKVNFAVVKMIEMEFFMRRGLTDKRRKVGRV